MYVTLFGIVIEVRPLQNENALNDLDFQVINRTLETERASCRSYINNAVNGRRK